MNLRDLPDMSDALKEVQAIEEKKKLDPVGKEDGDIDNDGDKDSSDSYLLNRRKAVKKAIAKEEVEQVDEADSLAAMAARREKRLQAQRKREGKTGAGHDFGHDHGISDAERKKRQDKEFKAFLGRKEDFDIVGWAEDAILELSEEEAIDSLTDEELVDIFETALLELAEGPEELEEMATILEGFEVLTEVSDKYYDSAVKSSKDAAAKIASDKKPSRGERLKAAAKAAGSKAKAGLKTAGKAAARGAGYTVGAAKRAGSAVKREFEAGHKRGKEGSGGGSSSSGESSGGGSTSSSSSSGGGEKKKGGSLLRKVGRLAGKAIKKGVGKTARLVSKGSGALAKRLGEDYEHIDHLVESGLFSLDEISNVIEERYKGKHGQSSAEYKDDRSPGGKMVSGDSKQSGAEYTHGRRVKAANPGSQPDEGGKTKPKSQGKMDKGTRADLEYRKANLKKEEVEVVDEGMKGALKGAATGAAIGTIVPVVGTGLGAAVGAAQGLIRNDRKDKAAKIAAKKARKKTEEVEYDLEEGVRDLDPEKGTAERKAKLEKKRGMKLDDHPQYKKEDRAATREQEIMEGILKRAAAKAKSEYGKYKKFGKASGEAVDRLQRMNQHKQDKYGPSTFKQRMKSGAEHNTDNEKKAKEGK